MEKPIMINGFPRSGTTYLYRYLKWKYGKALFEPLVSPQVAIQDVDDEETKSKLLLLNPFNKNASFYRSWWIYDRRDLEEFLDAIKGIPFKEVSLHFYLDLVEQKGWEVYHIIRHPADNYISYVNYFHKRRFFGRRIAFSLLKWLAKFGFDSSKFFALWEMATRMVPAYKFAEVRRSFEAAFVVMWTLANEAAKETLGEKRLLIYEKPESLKKLPEMEEFWKSNAFRPKKYPDREKVMETLRSAAERAEVVDSFDKLVELITSS